MVAIISSTIPDKIESKEQNAAFDREEAAIGAGLGYSYWCYDQRITKAEFETYQAFGIKEIKL